MIFEHFLWHHDHCFQSNSHLHELHPLHIQRLTQEGIQQNQQKSAKISESAHPVAPWQPPRDPGICSSDLQPAPEIQAIIYSTKISLSLQFPPPDSSTKSASASSFHHQAAAPHQPASSKASSQPAVNSTTLPHQHHGSQVCCLDILWLFSSIVF